MGKIQPQTTDEKEKPDVTPNEKPGTVTAAPIYKNPLFLAVCGIAIFALVMYFRKRR